MASKAEPRAWISAHAIDSLNRGHNRMRQTRPQLNECSLVSIAALVALALLQRLESHLVTRHELITVLRTRGISIYGFDDLVFSHSLEDSLHRVLACYSCKFARFTISDSCILLKVVDDLLLSRRNAF